jgi:hypothetical protein
MTSLYSDKRLISESDRDFSAFYRLGNKPSAMLVLIYLLVDSLEACLRKN